MAAANRYNGRASKRFRKLKEEFSEKIGFRAVDLAAGGIFYYRGLSAFTNRGSHHG
jgi:hypothetical protein